MHLLNRTRKEGRFRHMSDALSVTHSPICRHF